MSTVHGSNTISLPDHSLPRCFVCALANYPALFQHFHYSYLLHAAAALAHLRPEWATADNKNWVDTVIRDVNNPNKVGTKVLLCVSGSLL